MTAAPGSVRSEQDEIAMLEVLVGRILQVGVMASTLLIAAGTLLMVGQHDLGTREHAGTIAAVIDGLRRLRGWSLVDAGLFLLILTPVMRVAVSVYGYARSRDWEFFVVTSYVLAMLVVGFLIGKA